MRLKNKMKLNRIQYVRSIFSLPINQEPQGNDIDRSVFIGLAILIICIGMAGIYAVHVGLP